MPMVEASRQWRNWTGYGPIRTHIVIGPGANLQALRLAGAQHNETYTETPDFPDYPQAIRHALTPYFALDAIGSTNFKWLLLGDDDTIFVIPAILRLLNEAALSADDPHMLSDYHYECSDPKRPYKAAAPREVDPRCLPCPPDGPRFCPCKLPPGCTNRDNWCLNECSHGARVLPYGGAGIIYSIGMLRLLAEDPAVYLPMVFTDTNYREPWADRVLGDAPRILGYGFTNLTGAAPEVARPKRFFGTYTVYNDVRKPGDMLKDVKKAATAEPDMFTRMVSLHLRTGRLARHHLDLQRDYLPVYRRIIQVIQQAHGSVTGSSLQTRR